MKKTGLIFLSLLIVLTVSAFSQLTPRIEDIKKDSSKFLNEVVIVEGQIVQYFEDTAQTTDAYYMKDNWGGIIRVRTSSDLPEVGLRFRVTGPVSEDAASKYSESFISEESRELLETKATLAAEENDGSTDGETENWWNTRGQTFLIIFIGIAFLLLVGVLAYIIRWSQRSKELPGELPNDIPDQGGEVLDGKTIRMQMPPPGTLKLLPGRLEVTSGDGIVKEIRFFRPKGQTKAEITFGRAKGPAYTHIQLKPMTVSSRQAKMIFENKTIRMINYPDADSNPTCINDREMSVEESVNLKVNDKISMGEIEFIFRDQ